MNGPDMLDQFTRGVAGLAEWGPPDYVAVISTGRGQDLTTGERLYR